MPNLITAKEARRRLGGISHQTEWKWRQLGLLPEPIVITNRNFYDVDELNEFVDRHRKTPRAVAAEGVSEVA